MDKPFLDMTSVLGGLLLALVFLGNVDAQGSAGICVPVVRVRKYTAFGAPRNNRLKISCPVEYCEEIPTVRWFRVDETGRSVPVNQTDEITVTEERSTAEREIISHLTFRNISIQDDGIYKCQVSALDYTSESHNINVSVSDMILQTHNESSRKANNQRTQVPPSTNTGGSLRGQEKPRKQGSDMSKETLEPDMPSLHSATNQDEQGPQQIVYATLEHLTPRDMSLISIPSREQMSEYAAIRIY
ncbi:hypothetical protein NFI96_000293 [Prochilodus magdalenae]|nr:hypothetical protein NFI96_000293 [Prochilodus magdalenae]